MANVSGAIHIHSLSVNYSSRGHPLGRVDKILVRIPKGTAPWINQECFLNDTRILQDHCNPGMNGAQNKFTLSECPGCFALIRKAILFLVPHIWNINLSHMIL